MRHQQNKSQCKTKSLYCAKIMASIENSRWGTTSDDVGGALMASSCRQLPSPVDVLYHKRLEKFTNAITTCDDEIVDDGGNNEKLTLQVQRRKKSARASPEDVTQFKRKSISIHASMARLSSLSLCFAKAGKSSSTFHSIDCALFMKTSGTGWVEGWKY